MRLKMIGLAGSSLLLLAGCGPNSSQSASGACVQKPVCAVPAQPAPPPAATTPPPSYGAIPRPRRAVRYRSSRWRSGGGSYSRRSESYSYDGGVRDYAQVYGSVGDTRLAGVRVQVQSSDSYSQSTQSESSYSSYGGGSVVGYGGSGYVTGGCQGPCGQGGVRAAGRDRDGYLTWPSK
ncbi:hypothetical protein QO010_003400 [Caulobacter ginsengisoli]|uniref:Lipoprotein n=1 Tax=Caulobacter ginsengisoli TaxID=400775 RepID=A0ABU0IUC3_9CAUL|nr:hypothetical protein [Caulobacter ginsengisoli]MDQ0465611.1 hypothetical protein [Caulobacter ginsengisoli]